MVEIFEIFVVNWHIFSDNTQFFIILLSLKQDHTINLVTLLGQRHILSVFLTYVLEHKESFYSEFRFLKKNTRIVSIPNF